MRGQARCSVNMMTGVEVATPQLLRVCREGNGGFFKKWKKKNYTSSLSVCTAVRLYYALSRRAFSWPMRVLSQKLFWPYTEGTWLYCDYFIWRATCNMVVLTCFVMCGCVYVWVFWQLCGCFGNMCTCIYSSADKSLARPGRKQATATEDFDFHKSIL